MTTDGKEYGNRYRKPTEVNDNTRFCIPVFIHQDNRHNAYDIKKN